MAGLAFVYEIGALVVTGLVCVWFVRGASGLPMPPEPRVTRRGPFTGISAVLYLDEDAAADHCVAALQAEEYPKLQIIVVMGGARFDDVTLRRIQDDPRAILVDGTSPPPGWVRRNHAFDAGFRHAEHDFILFLDGNLLVRRGALERALSLAKQRGAGLLSVFPELSATTFAERLLVPFFMQLALTGVSFRRINDPDEEVASAFAPFFLFRREAYEAVGGHALLRSDRCADSALVQRINDRGYRYLLGNGIDLAVFVGQGSLAGIWRSWSRSFNEAIDNDRRKAVLLAALVVGVFAAPWVLLAFSIVAIVLSGDAVAASPWMGVMLIGSASVMVSALHRRALRNLLKIDDSLAWLQPLAALVTALMIVGSTFHFEGRRSSRPARGSAAAPASQSGRTGA